MNRIHENLIYPPPPPKQAKNRRELEDHLLATDRRIEVDLDDYEIALEDQSGPALEVEREALAQHRALCARNGVSHD